VRGAFKKNNKQQLAKHKTIMKTTSVKLTFCIAFNIIALAAWSARADMTTYDLNSANITPPSGDSAPFGSVVVNLTSSTTATITFTSFASGGYINLFGDGGTVAVNVNATSWTLGTITGGNSGTGFSAATYSNGGAGNEDGFGSFNQTINSDDGYTHSSDTVTLSLTDDSGTWASASSVLTPNSGGNVVAAHIFITTDPANAANGAINTGFATDGGTTTHSVPDGGSTMAMLGCVLIGLGGTRSWSSRRK
jgi:hypothetical protein